MLEFVIELLMLLLGSTAIIACISWTHVRQSGGKHGKKDH